MGGIYYFKWKMYERDINKKILEINQLHEKIISAKNTSTYKIYQIWKTIHEQGNNINYFALYRYLNFVKNSILSDLKDYNITRFTLSINPNKVLINTTLPSYNVIYHSWGLIELISSNSVVESLIINNFKKVDNWINLDIEINTK